MWAGKYFFPALLFFVPYLFLKTERYANHHPPAVFDSSLYSPF